MDAVTLALARSEIKGIETSGKCGSESVENITLTNDSASERLTKNLVGLHITDYRHGRRKLVLSEERPVLETVPAECVVFNIFNDAKFLIQYGTYDGQLNKPCFMLMGGLLKYYCAFFIDGTTEYNCLIYAYEDTTDTLGVGLTFKKGWHAFNSGTYANTPFDIERYPVFISSFEGIQSIDNPQFFESCFPAAETISYTVTDKNIITKDGTSYIFHSDVSGKTTIPNINAGVLQSFSFADNAAELAAYSDESEVTISWQVVHPIYPKYLPGVSLPVEELTTEFVPLEYVAVTAEESAQLDKAAATGLPLVVQAIFMGITIAEVFSRASAPGSPAPAYSRILSLNGTNFQFLILNEGDGWQIQMEES